MRRKFDVTSFRLAVWSHFGNLHREFNNVGYNLVRNHNSVTMTSWPDLCYEMATETRRYERLARVWEERTWAGIEQCK